MQRGISRTIAGSLALYWLLVRADSWSFLGTRQTASSQVALCRGSASCRSASTIDTIEEFTPQAAVEVEKRNTEVLADWEDFVQPERDLRRYRAVRLGNNLKVLLVSDQMTSGVGVEAAAVHVQAGHFDDTIPGLAHFHEHMLFLGTEKYPSEEEYESFLSQFGGFSNAYTDMEDTNYYFSVTTEAGNPNKTSDALSGALDRLAQFFIAPTFARDSVDRELKAIDSEYRNGRTSDAWRNFQLLKYSCNQTHPFSKFGCGNYQTLTSQGLDYLLQQLEVFWKTYYQTYNIRLAVVGHASLDALQKTVEETFGQLPLSSGPNRRIKSLPGQMFSRENAVYGITPFGPDQLGIIRNVIPFTEMRSIKVYFLTPPLDDPSLKASKPYRALSHALGHESPGSLHELLSDKGYLIGLSSGIGIDTSDFSLFTLTLSLTPKGMEACDEVLDYVFQWISLIKNDEDKLAAYHEELRRISAMNFRFRENGDPTDFCSTAAELLFDDETDPASILRESSETSDYDHDVARAFMDRIDPKYCMISILNSDFNQTAGTWYEEPRYGAQYQDRRISLDQMKAWAHPIDIDPHLHLPNLNEYIPSDFSLRCDDVPQEEPLDEDEVLAPPTLLVDQPNLRLWHKLDRFWRVPKSFIRLSILSSSIYGSPRSMTLNRIFQRVLNDDLNSYVYDASVAGCNYRVSCTPSGYRISVRGYSEKLPFLLETLTSRIKSLIEDMKKNDPILEEKFAKALEGLLRETKNYKLDPPHEIANYNSRLLMEQHVWYLDNYIDEMEGEIAAKNPLTMEECAIAAEQSLLGRIKCEALCMGNIDEEGARKVYDVIDRQFLANSRTLTEVETPRYLSLKLPDQEEARAVFGPSAANRSIPLIYQDIAATVSEENNAAEVIIQAGCELELGYDGMAILDLVTHMAYNSAYNQLRTKEQLGYIVSSYARKTAGSTWGMSVVVQSSVALPIVLEERIEAWLKLYRQELESMSAESIAKEASAVAAQLLEADTKLSQEVSRVWGDILNTEGLPDRMRTPAFDRLDLLAEELFVSDAEFSPAPSKHSRTCQDLKDKVLAFFDKHFAASPTRRAMAAHVYNQKSKAAFEAQIGKPGVLSTYADMRHLKTFLSSWPSAPYWRIEDEVDISCVSDVVDP